MEEFEQDSHTIQRKPGRKKWKIFFLIVGVVIIVPILFFIIVNLISQDIDVVDDADLRLSEVSLPPMSQNAYFDLVEASNNLSIEDLDTARGIADGIVWDETYIENLLADNRGVIELFNQAATKKFYQYPELVNPEKYNENLVLPPLNKIRDLAPLKTIESRYFQSQGEDERALESAMEIVAVSNKIMEGQTTVVEYLIALAYRSYALNQLNRIVQITSLEEDVVRGYVSELETMASSRDAAQQALKMEYAGILLTFRLLNNEPINESVKEVTNSPLLAFMSRFPLYYKPNTTLQYYADNIRTSIAYIDEECGTEAPVVEKKLSDNTSTVSLLMTENVIGKIFHDMTAASLTGIKDRICEQEKLIEEIKSNIQ